MKLFYSAVLFTSVFAHSISYAQSDRGVRVIDPKKEVPKAKSAIIDSERFELGGFVGVLSVDGFNPNVMTGLSLSYHVKPSILAQFQLGRSTVDDPTFQDRIDGTFISESGKKFSYYTLLAGYKILSGRSFFGKDYKYNSDIYVLGGVGNTEFAEESNASFVLGLSYRTVLTDFLTLNVDFKDHIVASTFLGDDRQTQNIEFSVGLNALF